MTANQIRYAQHLETARHNVASEDIEHRKAGAAEQTARAAVSQASTAAGQLAESIRANKEKERVNWWNAQNTFQENQRHNRETEQASWFNAQTQRLTSDRDYEVKSRQASAQERQASVSERQASVSERELENSRLRSQASLISARANSAMVGVQQSALSESIRHNLAYESEIHRSNLANETERKRSNVASEQLRRVQNAETVRSNLRNESINQQKTNVSKQELALAKDLQGYKKWGYITEGAKDLARGFKDVSGAIGDIGDRPFERIRDLSTAVRNFGTTIKAFGGAK